MLTRSSIPALEPARVAAVLAQLSRGRARASRCGRPGSFIVTSDRCAIEVYADQPGARTGDDLMTDSPLAVATDRAAIAQIASREGWRVEFTDEAMPVAEIWIENRALLRLQPEIPLNRAA